MVFGDRPTGLHNRTWPQVVYNGVVIALVLLIAAMFFMILNHAASYHEVDSIPLKLWEQARDLRLMVPSTMDAVRDSFGVPSPLVEDEPPSHSDEASSFYHPLSRPPHAQIFCFVVGAEGTQCCHAVCAFCDAPPIAGTGSTWMSKVLPADHRPHTSPARGITAVIHRLWSSGPIQQVVGAQQELPAKLDQLVPATARLSVLHVSAPDWDALHYPDVHSGLWSLFYQARFTLKVLVMYRDPAQAAHSNHRREWKHLKVGGKPDVASSARSTEKHMTLLSEQLRALPHPADVLAVDYHRVMSDPRGEAARIARYLTLNDLRTQKFERALMASRRPPSNYTKRLGPVELEFLHNFFDAERRSKWAYLVERTRVVG